MTDKITDSSNKYKNMRFADPGTNISDFCDKVVAECNKLDADVLMVFNGTTALCEPGMSAKWLYERWFSRRTMYQIRYDIIDFRSLDELYDWKDILWGKGGERDF